MVSFRSDFYEGGLLKLNLQILENDNIKRALQNWPAVVSKYQKPNNKKAISQILTAFLPFLAILVLMYFSLEWSYLITLGIAVIAAFFLVRIFIIQHDCGHQSFFKSKKWNNAIGFFSSIFSTIPYKYWRRMHNVHHAHNGQYEFRGLGDIEFLTIEEYRNRGTFGKLYYRLRRSPFVLFIIVPIVYMAIVLRIALQLKKWKAIRKSHVINNLMIIAVYGSLAIFLGWQKLLLVHIPVLLFFGMIAFWFFYIQHQHEHNYKAMKDNWDHLLASIRGSTYYKLPRILQWFSGNIGFHHIHHLNSRIPNYNLEKCARENPFLNQYVNVLTFRESLKTINNKLWDEGQKRMISFREFKQRVRHG